MRPRTFFYEEPHGGPPGSRSLGRRALLLGAVVVLGVFAHKAQLDPQKLVAGLPRVASWVPAMFPPDVRELGEVLDRAFETLAMATIGTLLALVGAFPLAFLGARNTTPHPVVYRAVRLLFNVSRGTEMLVFALIFTAAIGFGPFTGVLAIAFHMMGAIGKTFAEAIEPADRAAMEAVALTGASRLKVYRYALLPDVAPNLIAALLYMWEYTVRSSTILGIVGAGGIGQTLKDTIDLLDFPRMLTVLSVILGMVWGIDTLSDLLRRRVLHAPVREPPPPPHKVLIGGVQRA